MKTAKDDQTRARLEKRSEILEIATEIVFRLGYGRASMDQIHTKLGGSKRTLYSHFPNKESLFEAMVSQVSDRVLTALRPPLDGKDLRQTMLKIGTDYLGVLLSPDGIALYRVMVAEAQHFPELAKAFFENGPGRASAHLAAFFRDQQAMGYIDVADPQIAAEHFLGAVRGDIHLAAVLSAKMPSKHLVTTSVARATETFLTGTASETWRSCDGPR